MVKIKSLFVCPHCEEGITSPVKPDHCPGCGFKLSLGATEFSIPLTIAEQQERINDSLAHARFVLNLPLDTAANIMNDALHIIQTIPGKKVRASDIREIVGMAIKIGDIAKQYENFLAAGGSHTPGLFITTTGDKNEHKKTGDGGKTTPAVPAPLFAPMEDTERGRT